MGQPLEEAAADLGVREEGLAEVEEAVAALDEHVTAVGDVERLAGVLLDHQDGDAGGGDLEDLVEELVHDDRRDPGGRLVEHQQRRPGHQRAADGDPPALAAGELAGRLAALRLEDREQREDLLHGLGDVVVADVGAHLEVLLDG